MFKVTAESKTANKIRKSNCLKMYSSYKGIALFQVLLMTAVITILAIQFTQTARNQLSIASTISDRVQAQFELKTIEAELLFSLLTEKNQLNRDSSNAYVRNWNFYGEPFQLTDSLQSTDKNDRLSSGDKTNLARQPFSIKGTQAQSSIQISIQDLSGLIGIYQGAGVTKLKNLLIALQEEANSKQNQRDSTLEDAFSIFSGIEPLMMANSMADWQDDNESSWINRDEKEDYNLPGMPTNLPLQTIEELGLVHGFSPKMVELLEPYLTIRAQRFFNPMLAPLTVLSLYMPIDRAKEIIRLRRLAPIKQRQFESISGLVIEDGMSLFNSGQLKVVFEVRVNEVHLKYEVELLIQPYEKTPYIIYGIKI